MGRTDRVLLIVASVLVALLIASAGYLYWMRTETLAHQQPVDQAAGPTLAKIEVSETPRPPSKKEIEKPLAPRIPTQPPGSELGFIKRVTRSSGVYYVSYDPAAWLVGAQANASAKKHGLPRAANGYYIANDTHTLKRRAFAKNAVVVVGSTAASGKTATMTPAAFYKVMSSGTPDPVLSQAAWWVFLKDSKIVRLEQLLLR